MRRIKCSNPKCDATFAHMLGNKTVDLGRQAHHFTLIGGDFSLIGTCGKCGEKTTVFSENGAIVETELEFKDDAQLTEEERLAQEKNAFRQVEDGVEKEVDNLKPKDKPEELDADGKPIVKPTHIEKPAVAVVK